MGWEGISCHTHSAHCLLQSIFSTRRVPQNATQHPAMAVPAPSSPGRGGLCATTSSPLTESRDVSKHGSQCTSRRSKAFQGHPCPFPWTARTAAVSITAGLPWEGAGCGSAEFLWQRPAPTHIFLGTLQLLCHRERRKQEWTGARRLVPASPEPAGSGTGTLPSS